MSANSLHRRPRPPIDGSLASLVGYADWQAENNSSEPIAMFLSRHDPTKIDSVSYFEFAKATHRVAHLARPGREGKDGEVAAVLLHCDTIVYMTAVVGITRAGFIPFPMSPRNTAEAVYFMLKSTDSHLIVTHPPLHSLLAGVTALAEKDGYRIDVFECPTYQTMYPTSESGHASPSVDPYPPNKPHSPQDMCLYLHSSGSTGLPKAIPFTQLRTLEWILAFANKGVIPDAVYGVMAPPTFHAMGIVLQLFEPLASSQPVALFTPQAPAPPTIPSAQYVIDVARAIGCKILICAPTFLETWIHSPEAVKLLASMIVVIFAGGPVSKATGDKLISAGVNIRSVYGATETAGCCDTFHLDTLDPTPDWEWLSFKDGVKTRWVPQGDGTHELQFLTNEHFHPAIENLPDVPGYATKDLFIQHPSNSKLWRIVGRIDDVIVLGSAEKIVPLAQENYLQSLPFISGAIMFGRGRIQPGVLLEPKPDYAFDPKDTEALAKFRNQVWPYVVEANKLGPQFARVFKEMILATSPDKPLSRAAKGTTQRRAVYNQYAQEIDDLYNTVEESSDAHGVSAPHSWSPEAVLDWLTDHATSVNEGKTPSTTQDLFEQGFDSLSATYLRNRIIGAFRSSPDPFIAAAASSIPADIVFANPTLQWLASVVANLADPSAVSNSSKTHAEEVEDMVATYTKDLPIVTGKRPIDPSEGLVVVLTGSTGALGSHLLASLLKDDRIRKVYTLDRAEHIQERQQLAFEDRLLPLELLKSDKLRALTVNAGRADLGLDADILGEIKSNITHVIHNAWKVDFNLSLSSFESNIASTRRLIDIVSSCENAVRFFFTSSISSTISSDTKHPVPERVNEDPNTSAKFGYGASKYTAERIVAEAARKGLPAMSIRIGQICGATATGAWSSSDWVPIIVKSSVAIGALPIWEEEVSWIPMDVTSACIVDALFSCSEKTPPEVINIVHPRPVSGQALFEDMKDALERDRLKFVSYEEWLAKIEALAAASKTEQDLQRIPALKTMGFLRALNTASGTLTFDTTNAQTLSQTLKNAKPLGKEDAARWVRYWRSRGMLD